MGGGGIGLLKSEDGGKNWSIVGKDLAGLPLPAVVPTPNFHPQTNQQVILVSALDRLSGTGSKLQDGGLFLSKNGGQTFQRLSGLDDPTVSTGLPAGAMTDLVADPRDQKRFYAGVANKGVFRGQYNDDGSMTWTQIVNNMILGPFDTNNEDDDGDGTADNPTGPSESVNLANRVKLSVHYNEATGTHAVYAGLIITRRLEGVLTSRLAGVPPPLGEKNARTEGAPAIRGEECADGGCGGCFSGGRT